MNEGPNDWMLHQAKPAQWLGNSLRSRKPNKFKLKDYTRTKPTPLLSLASRKEDPRHIIDSQPALSEKSLIEPSKPTTPPPLDVQSPTPNTTSRVVFSMYYQDRPKHMFGDSSHASKARAPKWTTPSVGSPQIVANRLPIKSGESLSATKTIKEGHTNRSLGKGATGVSNIWMNKQARPRHIVDGVVELPFHKSKKRLDTLNSSFMKQTASRRSPNLVGAQITPKMAINTTSNVSKVHSKLLLDVEH